MSNEQYEDLVYFICEEMTLELNETLVKIAVWGDDFQKMSSNFFALDEQRKEPIRQAMFQVATQLWLSFKNKNMFDFQNTPELSFPFVLREIVGTNLMFIKDNVISSNEVNMYGQQY